MIASAEDYRRARLSERHHGIMTVGGLRVIDDQAPPSLRKVPVLQSVRRV